MAVRPEIFQRDDCQANLRADDPKDLEPLKDITNTPKDRELYPNDWMSVIFMTPKVYEGLLTRLKPILRSNVHWMHPNKALWVTLRHFAIGDTVRPWEVDAVEETCHSIWDGLQEEFLTGGSKFPDYRAEGPAIAAEFEEVWDVQNCLGAIGAKLFKSKHLEQINVLFDGQRRVAELHWAVLVDAKLQIRYITLLTGEEGESFQEMIGACYIGDRFKNPPLPIPPPSAPKGSKVKLPYTFFGDHKFGARNWLRVATHGKDEANKEVERAMKPANVTLTMIATRFGVLKLNHPLILQTTGILSCIPILHNYFMLMNPGYADLKKLLDEYKTAPESVPLPRATRFTPEEAHEAMLRMKMDDNSFHTLADQTGLPPHILTELLGFIGTGELKKKIDFVKAMEWLQSKLPGYSQELPMPPTKWLQISKEFEAKMQFPNCAGVIATRRVAIYAEPGIEGDFYGTLVMFLDANYRVSYADLVLNYPSVAETVDRVLEKKELNLNKSMVFIGSEGLKKHRLLVRPGDTAHLTDAQVNRGLMMSEKVIDALVDRFAVMNNSVAKRAPVGDECAHFVCSFLHNFLLDNSSIYAAGF